VHQRPPKMMKRIWKTIQKNNSHAQQIVLLGLFPLTMQPYSHKKAPRLWTEASVWSHFLRKLGRRAWGSEELYQDALQKYAIPESLAQPAIEKLYHMNILDDGLYAEQLLRQCQRKGYGPRRIQNVFRTKFLGSEHIDRLFPRVLGDEQASIGPVAEKKWATMPAKLSQEQKEARLFRFLVGRGFSSQAVMSVIQSLR